MTIYHGDRDLIAETVWAHVQEVDPGVPASVRDAIADAADRSAVFVVASEKGKGPNLDLVCDPRFAVETIAAQYQPEKMKAGPAAAQVHHIHSGGHNTQLIAIARNKPEGNAAACPRLQIARSLIRNMGEAGWNFQLFAAT